MARRLGLGKATARRTSAGVAKVSMTLPYELAWRLGVRSRMLRVALGEMCSDALWTIVEGEQMPWDRYKARLLDVPKDSPPVTTGEGGGKDVDGTLTVREDVPPPAPVPASGGGQKGRKDPAEVAAAITAARRGRVQGHRFVSPGRGGLAQGRIRE